MKLNDMWSLLKLITVSQQANGDDRMNSKINGSEMQQAAGPHSLP